MIVRNLANAEASGRHIASEGWDSTRLLLKNDNMGCSFHITTVYEGAQLDLHFQNHLESVYCISGAGEIMNLADGTVYSISPGTVYIVDEHDQHVLRATEEMKMACICNPPLQEEAAPESSAGRGSEPEVSAA